MWRRRQSGHQQPGSLPPASGPGTATTGGSWRHQHGAALASAMAQLKGAPQRVQVLMRLGGNEERIKYYKMAI